MFSKRSYLQMPSNSGAKEGGKIVYRSYQAGIVSTGRFRPQTRPGQWMKSFLGRAVYSRHIEYSIRGDCSGRSWQFFKNNYSKFHQENIPSGQPWHRLGNVEWIKSGEAKVFSNPTLTQIFCIYRKKYSTPVHYFLPISSADFTFPPLTPLKIEI